MTAESKVCQNCKKEFRIEPEDFAFYEKIRVPPPTFCPLCSMQRRMVWRNERALYRRKDAEGKEVISIFAPEKPFTVYERKKWWSDDWDPLEYGQSYDFSKPFFQQFRELMERIPLIALFNNNAVNSEYCNHTEDSRNCYLLFASFWNENVSYSKGAIKCKDSLDLFFGEKEELSYENIHCKGSYRLFFSKNCVSCQDSMFLRDCSGCSHCFGCVNLRNKSYHIFNEPYSKEEYEGKIEEFRLGRFKDLEEMRTEFKEFQLSYPYKYAHLINSPGSTGDGLHDCRNCKWCFDATNNVENCKYIANAGYSLKDSYHGYGVGLGELMYEIVDTGIGASKVFASVVSRNGNEFRYVMNCHGGSNLFGCIGLRNKHYCILNKQYSQEEYEELVPKIIKQMNEMPYRDRKERVYGYGEFFPAEISPFAYNETVAQEYFPLTKDEAVKAGFALRDEDIRSYSITADASCLAEDIEEVGDSIENEVIGCAHEGRCKEQCTTAYKIIPYELEFYRKMNLPLPRLCPNCRHYRRLAERSQMRLWHRRCVCAGVGSENGLYQNQVKHFHGSDHCPNEFETPYAPEKPEIVYCEQCYQAEVI